MITTILLHTPLWVWLLLAALIALGAWQSRPRSLTPLQVFILPAVMLALGLVSGLAAFSAMPWLLLVWLKALTTGAWVGRRLAPAARWDGQRLHLAASWVPLVLVVAVFGLRYTGAVALALHPDWRVDPTVMTLLTAVSGVLSGLFAGRALALFGRTRGGMTIGRDVALA